MFSTDLSNQIMVVIVVAAAAGFFLSAMVRANSFNQFQ